MKTLVLIDGHAILHRAYHALPQTLVNRHGQLINAAYGFTRMLFRVVEDLKPDYLAVAFDINRPNFRHQLFMGYQAQRPEIDKELEDQIDIVKQILVAFGIPFFQKEGFEADDLIGTMAKQAAKKKIKTIILTGDRDLFQLINKFTLIYVPQKGVSEAELFDQKKVKQTMGISPDQIVDYKGLVGDTSDNYPGVPGIGPKTAGSLLQRFKTLKKIYQILGEITGSIKEKLEKGKESAFLSQKLAKIETAAPIKLNLKKCLFKGYDQERVLTLFKHLGFRSLLNRLPGMKEEKGKEKDEQLGLL